MECDTNWDGQQAADAASLPEATVSTITNYYSINELVSLSILKFKGT